jgi:hypothetical protein
VLSPDGQKCGDIVVQKVTSKFNPLSRSSNLHFYLLLLAQEPREGVANPTIHTENICLEGFTMGLFKKPHLVASGGAEDQIDMRSIERYQIDVAVAGSSCNKYPGQ